MLPREYLLQLPPLVRAEHFARHMHRRHHRKTGAPYERHLTEVNTILRSVCAPKDVQVGGWLHDVVEKRHDVTFDDLERLFDRREVRFVRWVTEEERGAPWEERKIRALKRIASMPKGGMLIKSADTLSNLRSSIIDYMQLGEAMFTGFHADKERLLARNTLLIRALGERWPQNPLLPLLTSRLDMLVRLWR